MYPMSADTYLLMAIVVAGATWFIGGIFKKYTVKKIVLTLIALVIFSTVIPLLVILFQTTYGSLQPELDIPIDELKVIPSDEIDKLKFIFFIELSITELVIRYFTHNVWDIIAVSAIGIVSGSGVGIVKDFIDRRRKEREI